MIDWSVKSPRRVLCLGAHADDIEIGCGGTLLRLAANHPGLDIGWCVFSGSVERRKEAVQSARTMLPGLQPSLLLVEKFRESHFPDRWEAIKDACEGIRKRFEPDLIFTHYRGDRHQDHRVLSDLTWNTFRNHAIVEYEIPKFDGDFGAPNVFVPLEPRLAKRKVRGIIQGFPSQSNKHWFTEDLLFSVLRIRGMECASTSGYAEAFYGRKIVLGL